MANLPYPPISTPTQMAMSALDLAVMTQTINQYAPGLLAGLGPAFTTTGASANTILSVNIPGGTLPVGTVIRFKAAGTAGAANTTTMTLNFGAFVATTALVNAGANGWWGEIDITITGAATESSAAFGVGNVTPVQTVTQTSGTVNTANAVAITGQITASASTSTVVTATIEIVR
jgi:hypothetical protein